MLQLPSEFVESISCCTGFDEMAFKEAHQSMPPTSIRLNPFKPATLEFPLHARVPWHSKGFYLEKRPSFTNDVLFQAGCYYVQEAGSMFMEHALTSCVDFNQSLMALDVCAAPGGKSTLLNSLLTQESVLVCNELVKSRADVLSQNLSKWGTCNVVVTNNDPSAYQAIESVFDIVLVDAPCSGSGLFRKQHDAIDEWSLDQVNVCSQRQKRILADVLPSLKQDGILVYSTCSYSQQENEMIADWLVSEFQLETINIPIEPTWGIVETQSEQHKAFGYRFYPDKTPAEGFFCAVFKKSNALPAASFKKKKQGAFVAFKPKEKELFKEWLANLNSHVLTTFKDDVLLTNQAALDFINQFPHLYFKKVGSTLGSIIKTALIPHHDLALSIHKANAIQTISCSRDEAISFLKKELQHIHGVRGWNLMTYQHFGLGWVKHLGNRVNNYLPGEFKIIGNYKT